MWAEYFNEKRIMTLIVCLIKKCNVLIENLIQVSILIDWHEH